MRCVVQRVTSASVTVGGEVSGQIGSGVLVLIGVADGDTEADFRYIAEKVPNLRIFGSLTDTGGEILAVSQFTLYGDARGGRRPSYFRAAKPAEADAWYRKLIACWREKGIHVETGVFRAEMQVALVNDGPVTILLDSEKAF